MRPDQNDWLVVVYNLYTNPTQKKIISICNEGNFLHLNFSFIDFSKSIIAVSFSEHL